MHWIKLHLWSLCQGSNVQFWLHNTSPHCFLWSVKCVSRGQLAQPHKVSRGCSSISCKTFFSTNFWHLVDKVKQFYTSFRFRSVLNFMHTFFSTNIRHPFDKIEGEITHVATYISRWFCWENVVHWLRNTPPQMPYNYPNLKVLFNIKD